ncbi:16S rRNA (guanine(527)-N(7))-methyltransferase RsmG [Pectinatus cerevisiiphilus]|uniref:Ribosomal RNA small subunit methyltransferase G n=1 Tax=Pectinatus cerevisiiphilus TaxID=86956 RepID=A0A4R3KF26_9FIRM|nr:16S rRNA (guanine(527)-N(7))-methyltransferase RsmG [Pectinatus cerevisiiphilus]TCS81868.1 16S rRNA (guanine527-N7)-methyltransferase [Pectinatus cerevisiiphilus]
MVFGDYLLQRAKEYGIQLSKEQYEKFNAYYELLLEWNSKINLTAITAPDEVAIKHIVDSLSAWDEKRFSPTAKIIDVGTGAGFPGIPLKIMHPGLQLTLLDSLAKRIKFLQTVAAKLNITDIEFLHGRAEEIGRRKPYREKFDIVFSRAVARMPVLCEYALPLVKKEGYFTALKGRQYEAEAGEAHNAIKVLGGVLAEVKPVKLPGLDDVRAVIYVQKVSKTPAVYPRKAGTPERKPLL